MIANDAFTVMEAALIESLSFSRSPSHFAFGRMPRKRYYYYSPRRTVFPAFGVATTPELNGVD